MRRRRRFPALLFSLAYHTSFSFSVFALRLGFYKLGRGLRMLNIKLVWQVSQKEGGGFVIAEKCVNRAVSVTLLGFVCVCTCYEFRKWGGVLKIEFQLQS
jgi:hypothetical protein